jgi:hypothetical protein
MRVRFANVCHRTAGETEPEHFYALATALLRQFVRRRYQATSEREYHRVNSLADKLKWFGAQCFPVQRYLGGDGVHAGNCQHQLP